MPYNNLEIPGASALEIPLDKVASSLSICSPSKCAEEYELVSPAKHASRRSKMPPRIQD
eukprot:CAMPEP_0168626144 /NCGR_PEP_ID=MMETSP0449_2-20121227/10453_1 /TAXON_ID=1082188 /ORGANISM="Strombidium rassoulzadegani, Strain ras09" /LENGTH=58 /DNA_ID=CAMNT_0008668075 /DNA_START=1 /DNA_END=177 /DNA_ORIENTATION=+